MEEDKKIYKETNNNKIEEKENNNKDKDIEIKQNNKKPIETKAHYKNKNGIKPLLLQPLEITIDNGIESSSSLSLNNMTTIQKYSVTIPYEVIEGDILVVLVDDEEMIVMCPERKKGGDNMIITEEELIPQIYEVEIPKDAKPGEECNVFINNVELEYRWPPGCVPGQLLSASLPKKNKNQTSGKSSEEIEHIKRCQLM